MLTNGVLVKWWYIHTTDLYHAARKKSELALHALMSNDLCVWATARESTHGIANRGCCWWVAEAQGQDETFRSPSFVPFQLCPTRRYCHRGPNKLRNKTHTTHAGQPPGVLVKSWRHWGQRRGCAQGASPTTQEWRDPVWPNVLGLPRSVLPARPMVRSLTGQWTLRCLNHDLFDIQMDIPMAQGPAHTIGWKSKVVWVTSPASFRAPFVMGSHHEPPLHSVHQGTQPREERPTNATVTLWPWALGLDLTSSLQSLQNLQKLAVLLGLMMEP